MASSKSDLRNDALSQRDALSANDRAAAAGAIGARGLPVSFEAGAVVSGFWPIGSEIDPRPLLRAARQQGARLALPVITPRGQPLLFRRWADETPLVRSQFGILEPAPDAPEVLPDILLVPLAAFDRAGHRIGYGGGYYDRTLAKLRAVRPTLAIGIAFAVQEIAGVPVSPHDARLDFMLTENEIIDFRSV